MNFLNINLKIRQKSCYKNTFKFACFFVKTHISSHYPIHRIMTYLQEIRSNSTLTMFDIPSMFRTVGGGFWVYWTFRHFACLCLLVKWFELYTLTDHHTIWYVNVYTKAELRICIYVCILLSIQNDGLATGNATQCCVYAISATHSKCVVCAYY